MGKAYEPFPFPLLSFRAIHRQNPLADGTAFGTMVVVGHRDLRNTRNYVLRCSDCGYERVVRESTIRFGAELDITKRVKCPFIPLKPVDEIGGAIILHSYRSNAKKNNRAFTLTGEAFHALLGQACFYCGSPPRNTCRTSVGPFLYNGVDRVDSKGGYTPDNTVPCCWTCNRAKLARDQTEFIAWIKRCAAHLDGKT